MYPLAELKDGLVILNPFLHQYNFDLDNFVEVHDDHEHYTIVTFKNENKKFIIDYRFSVGQVLYQYHSSIVTHPFYLDHLGFAKEKKFTDFLKDYNIGAFDHILHDFNYLVDDFFAGECMKLVEYAKLQDDLITLLDKKIRDESSIILDNRRIDKARHKFRVKEFKISLDLYNAVEHKNLIVELDNKIIEFCKRHV